MSSWEKELVRAITANNLANVKALLLVRNKESLERKSWREDEAPLTAAAMHHREDMMRVLVHAGVDVNSYVVAPCGNGRYTSLHKMVSDSFWSDSVKVLLDLGADWTLKGRSYMCSGTSLDWAKEEGNDEAVTILEEHIAYKKNEMDVLTKRKLETDLNKADEIADAIKTTLVQLKQVDKTLKPLQNEKTRLEDKVRTLRMDSDYRSVEEVKRMRQELQDIGKLPPKVDKIQEDDPDKHCPVCFEAPEKVFSCIQCHNWICGRCWEEKKLGSCPSCRADFKITPPLRNQTAERLLRKS